MGSEPVLIQRDPYLSAFEQAFVDAYIACDSATDAVRQIDPDHKAPHSAAYTLMKKPAVEAAIAKRKGELAVVARVTTERLAAEYANIVYSDPREWVEWVETGDVAKLSEASRRTAQEISSTPARGGGQVRRVKFYDKVASGKFLATLTGILDKDAPAAQSERDAYIATVLSRFPDSVVAQLPRLLARIAAEMGEHVDAAATRAPRRVDRPALVGPPPVDTASSDGTH